MDVKQLQSCEWFQELMEDVRIELERLLADPDDRETALRRELDEIRQAKDGWRRSLGNPQLAPSVRSELEADWSRANEHEQSIEHALSQRENRERLIEQLLTHEAVVDRINRLAEVLSRLNPTQTNIELSLHIDRIECFADGRVAMRTCRLGAMTDAVAFLQSEAHREEPAVGEAARAKPRRRVKRRVEAIGPEGADLEAAASLAADPQRFAGLTEDWFWIDEFHVPERLSWAKENAAEVARLRRSGLKMRQLVEQFGKTPPTIREALRYAREQDPSLTELPARMPRGRWHEDHAAEVAELKSQGLSTDDLASRFGVSDTTIRKAITHAREVLGLLDQGADP